MRSADHVKRGEESATMESRVSLTCFLSSQVK